MHLVFVGIVLLTAWDMATAAPRLTNQPISPLGDKQALISAIKGETVYRCVEQQLTWGKKNRSAALKDIKTVAAARGK